MSDDPNLNREDEAQEEKKPSYTPASFEKRVAAWVGVVYMVMLTLSVTYMIATARVLTGTAPLLLPPGAAGVAAAALHRRRAGRTGTVLTVLLVLLCAAAFLLGLLLGIPALLANFGR